MGLGKFTRTGFAALFRFRLRNNRERVKATTLTAGEHFTKSVCLGTRDDQRGLGQRQS